MPDVKILVIGRHAEIMQTLLRLIRRNPQYIAEGAATDDEALHFFRNDLFDLVLLSSGIPAASEQMLRETFHTLRPGIRIIQHFGGGSGLLENEIRAALENNPSGNFNV